MTASCSITPTRRRFAAPSSRRRPRTAARPSRSASRAPTASSLALERMDGAPALGVNVVVAKLHTAIVGLKDTIERHGKGVNPADYNDPRITTFGGGVVAPRTRATSSAPSP